MIVLLFLAVALSSRALRYATFIINCTRYDDECCIDSCRCRSLWIVTADGFPTLPRWIQSSLSVLELIAVDIDFSEPKCTGLSYGGVYGLHIAGMHVLCDNVVLTTISSNSWWIRCVSTNATHKISLVVEQAFCGYKQ